MINHECPCKICENERRNQEEMITIPKAEFDELLNTMESDREELRVMIDGIGEGYSLQRTALKKLIEALLKRNEMDYRTCMDSAEMFDYLDEYKADLEALIK